MFCCLFSDNELPAVRAVVDTILLSFLIYILVLFLHMSVSIPFNLSTSVILRFAF